VLTTVTDADQQTDHTTQFVTIGRIGIHSTAMQPNNDNLLTIKDDMQ